MVVWIVLVDDCWDRVDDNECFVVNSIVFDIVCIEFCDDSIKFDVVDVVDGGVWKLGKKVVVVVVDDGGVNDDDREVADDKNDDNCEVSDDNDENWEVSEYWEVFDDNDEYWEVSDDNDENCDVALSIYVVAGVGGGAHLNALLQSHGLLQLVKQFLSGVSLLYNRL